MSIFRTDDEQSLREIRRSFGWSQERLADALKVSVATLSRWERGKTMPPVLAPLTRQPNRVAAYLRAMVDREVIETIEGSQDLVALFHSMQFTVVTLSRVTTELYPLTRATIGLPAAPFTRSETRRTLVENHDGIKRAMERAGSGFEWIAPPGAGGGIISDGMVMDWNSLGNGLMSAVARVMTDEERSLHEVGSITFYG